MWSILAEISLCLWDTVSPSKDILLDAKAANISWASESLLFVAWYKLSKLIFSEFCNINLFFSWGILYRKIKVSQSTFKSKLAIFLQFYYIYLISWGLLYRKIKVEFYYINFLSWWALYRRIKVSLYIFKSKLATFCVILPKLVPFINMRYW